MVQARPSPGPKDGTGGPQTATTELQEGRERASKKGPKRVSNDITLYNIVGPHGWITCLCPLLGSLGPRPAQKMARDIPGRPQVSSERGPKGLPRGAPQGPQRYHARSHWYDIVCGPPCGPSGGPLGPSRGPPQAPWTAREGPRQPQRSFKRGRVPESGLKGRPTISYQAVGMISLGPPDGPPRGPARPC